MMRTSLNMAPGLRSTVLLASFPGSTLPDFIVSCTRSKLGREGVEPGNESTALHVAAVGKRSISTSTHTRV